MIPFLSGICRSGARPAPTAFATAGFATATDGRAMRGHGLQMDEADGGGVALVENGCRPHRRQKTANRLGYYNNVFFVV